MHLTVENLPWCMLAGALTGIVGAMLGTGGGVFLIPALVLGWGLPMHEAIGTSILSVIATSSAVASTNVERGTANMRLGMTLEVATSLGAIAGALTAGWLSPRVLEASFAVILLPTAALLYRGRAESPRGTSGGNSSSGPDVSAQADEADAQASQDSGEQLGVLGARYIDDASGRAVAYRVERLWGGLFISFLAGNLSGLLGIGGGIFKVPALRLLCGVPIRAAAATSNFMIGVTAAASAMLYYGRGEVLPAETAAVVLGVLAGSALGTVLNRRVHDAVVQKLFAGLLVAVAAQMMYRAFTD